MKIFWKESFHNPYPMKSDPLFGWMVCEIYLGVNQQYDKYTYQNVDCMSGIYADSKKESVHEKSGGFL